MILQRIGEQQEQAARCRTKLAELDLRAALGPAVRQSASVGQPRAWLRFHPLLTCGALVMIGGVAAALVQRIVPARRVACATIAEQRPRRRSRLSRMIGGGVLLAFQMLRQSLSAAAMQVVAGALTHSPANRPSSPPDVLPNSE